MRKSGWEEKVVTLVTLSHLSIKVFDFLFCISLNLHYLCIHLI